MNSCVYAFCVLLKETHLRGKISISVCNYVTRRWFVKIAWLPRKFRRLRHMSYITAWVARFIEKCCLHETYLYQICKKIIMNKYLKPFIPEVMNKILTIIWSKLIPHTLPDIFFYWQAFTEQQCIRLIVILLNTERITLSGNFTFYTRSRE